jgi:hypothetical protein
MTLSMAAAAAYARPAGSGAKVAHELEAAASSGAAAVGSLSGVGPALSVQAATAASGRDSGQ